MAKRDGGTRARTNLALLLEKLTRAAMPDVDSAHKLTSDRCAVEAEKIVDRIRKEAYEGERARRYSMLRLINDALASQSATVIAQVSHSKDGTEKKDEKTKAFLSRLTQVKVTPLRATFAGYADFTAPLCTTNRKSWSNWISGTQKPTKNKLALLHVLLYGILHPRSNETPEAYASRLADLFSDLLTDFLHQPALPAEDRANYCRYEWFDRPGEHTALTDGMRGLCGLTLFLFNLHIDSDSEVSALSELENEMIDGFSDHLRKEINTVNRHINAFRRTQDTMICTEQPYITGTEARVLRRYTFIPPKSAPWADDFLRDTPARAVIEGEAGSGKTALCQALGAALLRGCLQRSKPERVRLDAYAQALRLGDSLDWVVVAFNAQECMWYWENRDREAPSVFEDLTDLFFRRTMARKQIAQDAIDICMDKVVPEKLKTAHENLRLVFLFDGYEEMADATMRTAFLAGLRRFFALYPKAHMLLFSRPLAEGDYAPLRRWLPRRYALTPMGEAQQVLLRDQYADAPPPDGGAMPAGFGDALGNPLLLTLLCTHPDKTFFDCVWLYISQTIRKEYDCLNRRMLLPGRLTKPALVDLLSQIAWEEMTKKSSVLFRLRRRLSRGEQAEGGAQEAADDLHALIMQSGVLAPCEDGQDCAFISEDIQSVLAARHILRLLNMGEDPSALRAALFKLPDERYRAVVFSLLHMSSQPDSLFGELLMMDFALREWGDAFRDAAAADIKRMAHGLCGATPLQTADVATLSRVLSLVK